jgi:hypothetical protein
VENYRLDKLERDVVGSAAARIVAGCTVPFCGTCKTLCERVYERILEFRVIQEELEHYRRGCDGTHEV